MEEAKNYSLTSELWSYMKQRKKWWLLPLLILALIIGVLILVSHSSVLSPFIYALG